MAHLADLTPCTYFRGPVRRLLASGWLEREQPFPVGRVPRRAVRALEVLLEHAWQPFLYRGLHECTLCRNVVTAARPSRYSALRPTRTLLAQAGASRQSVGRPSD